VKDESDSKCNQRDDRDFATALDPPEQATRGEINFDTLAEVVPQIVWITGSDGKNIYFNKQWVDYTVLTLEESHGDGCAAGCRPSLGKTSFNASSNKVGNGK
jgi:PAS domain-containing protein